MRGLHALLVFRNPSQVTNVVQETPKPQDSIKAFYTLPWPSPINGVERFLLCSLIFAPFGSNSGHWF